MGIGALVEGKNEIMNKHLLLRLWSVAVGAMDALTGLLLIITPLGVLRLLRIEPPSPDALIFLSWIGAFVMAVGLSYGLALGKHCGRGETVWMVTSLVRMMVAVFLTIQVTSGSMQMQWMLVAVSDASVAIVQMVIVRKKWWREGKH
jgi:hypothetical protein